MSWHVSLYRERFTFVLIVVMAMPPSSASSGKEPKSQGLAKFGTLGLRMRTLLANGAGIGLRHGIRGCWNGMVPHFFRMSC